MDGVATLRTFAGLIFGAKQIDQTDPKLTLKENF